MPYAQALEISVLPLTFGSVNKDCGWVTEALQVAKNLGKYLRMFQNVGAWNHMSKQCLI